MRARLLRSAKLLGLPTAGLVYVVAFVPGRAELAARVYALLLAALGLAELAQLLRRRYPRTAPLRTTARRTKAPLRPDALVRLENEIALGVANAFDTHYRLRPRVRSLARELLAGRHGVSLDGDEATSRTLLGAEAWDLVRADRPAPGDRTARGIATAELGRVVESLERL